MGFESFNLKYYKEELQKLDMSKPNNDTIYHARQLKKMLDDLIDEGYTNLSEDIEKAFKGVSRLESYIKENGTTPFPIYKIKFDDLVFTELKDVELNRAIEKLATDGKSHPTMSDNPFLAELIDFCEWIGHEKDTAYIFLLRDTLLPYIYHKEKYGEHVYPWLLNRQTLAYITGNPFIDDIIRSPIFKALEEQKCDDFGVFCDAVVKDIRVNISDYKKLKSIISSMLHSIKEKKIVVVESGCSGTFPMLLRSLDDRVEIKMYSTYPYLMNVYGDRIYSHKYENVRLFETLYSQDQLFHHPRVKNNRFYVRRALNKEINQVAHEEVKYILSNIKK